VTTPPRATGTDVLVVGDRIAAVGPALEVPPGTVEIDATDGVVHAGHDRHPPAHVADRDARLRRGLDADPVLRLVLPGVRQALPPEDVHAGNLLAAAEAIDAGVTTCVDWSHGLQTVEHADAAVDALQAVPGRFVLAYGNIQQPPAEWSGSPQFRDFVNRRISGDDMLGFQMAFDVTGDPAFPEKGAFEVARELGVPVTTHAGVWGATNDDGIRLMYENGFMTPETIYVHAATLSADSYHRIAATGGSISVSTESEQSAGQGYPPTWALRAHGIPVSLSMDTSVWWSGDLFSAMRTTLGADRSREHLAAHATGDTVTCCTLRADQVVEWATRGGARALGRDDLGHRGGRTQGRPGADQERTLPRVVPGAQPARPRRVPGPARRRAHRARGRPDREVRAPARRASTWRRIRREVEDTVEHLRSTLGEEAWVRG
jgi:cytosine/adenosine deaminase-related metal-dependent hydrolase